MQEYIFSVIIAVYNSAPFLEETLDSVIIQRTDGFCRYKNGAPTDEPIERERIFEIIAVDDGSTDGSGKICDAYAEKYPFVTVIHKPNGGVASARNEGMRHASGKYLNFLDSDDKLSPELLYRVYNFFERHYDETDIVTVPLVFFDAVTGPHWQNYKFRKYPRVADLYNEYDSPLMFVNASFFKSDAKRVQFSDKLVCGEDIRFIFEIVAEKMTIGLLPGAVYYYRRRSVGEASLIQSAKKKYGWYFDYFTNLVEWAHGFCTERWGYMPAYYQSLLVCDIKWRFKEKNDEIAQHVLGEEYPKYREVLYASLRYFYDKYIVDQRDIFREHKCLMLTAKHGRLPERCIYPDDIRLRFGNTLLCWLSGCYAIYERIELGECGLYLEGFSTFVGVGADEQIRTIIEVATDGGAAHIECECIERNADEYRNGDLLLRAVPFKCSIPHSLISEGARLTLTNRLNGEKIIKKNIRYGRFCMISDEFKHLYITGGGLSLEISGYSLKISRCGAISRLGLEARLFFELRRSDRLGAKKAALARIAARLFGIFKKKRILLLSDRVNRSGDNAEALFLYLSGEHRRDLSVYFLIDRDSPDFLRLSKFGRVIDRTSARAKLLYLTSDVIASSSADAIAFDPFLGYSSPYRDFLNSKKTVFLQHGVTKDDLSDWIGKYKSNFSGITCAASAEAESFLAPEYGYTKDEVWLTGLARYDRLYTALPKYITVMPTWRMYLSRWNPDREGTWSLFDSFKGSEYFAFYNRLINDKGLICAARDRGYTLAFMPHPNILPYIGLFDKSPDVRYFTTADEYRDVFAESALVLTDYSSIAFDFAYLGRPVLYAQFDKEEFFGGNHAYKRGYFDYESDGFGEVLYDYDSTVRLLVEYIAGGCRLKDKYRSRIDSFFAYRDESNCKRIVQRIEELLEN